MEARITINGVELNPGQSMTVRVAIGHFASEMEDPFYLGRDEHGIFMTKMYNQHSREVEKIIIDTINENRP